MDFAVFSKSEVESICQAAIDHMPDFMRQSIVEEFGGVEQWRQHYIEVAAKENMQRGYQKLVEWYGGKDAALNSFLNPPSQEVIRAQEQRIDAVLNKLLEKRGQSVDSFAVKEIVGEYGFVIKHLYQLKQERGVMLAIAASYRNERLRAAAEQKYGAGAADWFAQAIEAFYGRA